MIVANKNASYEPYPAELRQIMNINSAEESLSWLSGWDQIRSSATPLYDLSGLADRLRVARVFFKDESVRSPLGSFKALGAPIALVRLILRQCPDRKMDPRALIAGKYADMTKAFTVISATDGNHGRALAAAAEAIGCTCVIVLHANVSAEREAAIASHGAKIVRIDGNYDESVHEAARLAQLNGWQVVADTSYEGYEEIPRDVMQGYGAIAAEALAQADAKYGAESPYTHVLLQGGVGGLAAGVISYFWEYFGAKRPKFIIVEPVQADCLFQSAKSGQVAKATGSVDSIMAGLACGEPSPLAWEFLRSSVDYFMTITDDDAIMAMRVLAKGSERDVPIVVGESGAAGFAGLEVLLKDESLANLVELNARSKVLLINTEGATAPQTYQKLTGESVKDVLARQTDWFARHTLVSDGGVDAGARATVGQVSSRDSAIAAAMHTFDSGDFLRTLDRRVQFHTESQEPSQMRELYAYLTEEMIPTLQGLGFETKLVENPEPLGAPVLLAARYEGDGLPTVVTYGHGDAVRGYDGQWEEGLEPWRVIVKGDRLYGRGTADNKGQHSVNLSALEAVIAARGGKLGFNVKVILEMGEEVDSLGLDQICAMEKNYLSGDLFLASDGPRVSAERPTVFLGSRGELNFDLEVNLRDSGHHSGNWGGALRNPATVLANAIATLVDKDGRILVDGLRSPPITDDVRQVLSDIELGTDASAPEVDPNWGEPGLTPVERVIGANTVEVLAFKSGNPDAVVNAIPPTARAHCQLRFVVGTDWENAQACLDEHFGRLGFKELSVVVKSATPATRLNLDDPWVDWVLKSIQATTGKKPALIPNLGGTVPNVIFEKTLGLPTIWVPHSYPACSQHAPNEHFLGSVAREALGLMAGIWWDLGDSAAEVIAMRQEGSYVTST